MSKTVTCVLSLCALVLTLCVAMPVSADVFADYENGGKSAYHADPNVNSRRTDHFLIRFGPKPREGFMVEQMFQGQLQFLENVYDTWQILGLRPMGGIQTTKYRTIVEPAETWDGDTPGTAVGFMETPAMVPGIHIPCNSLAYKSPNGCTPHECGHGWQNQHADSITGGLPMMQPPGLTESLANWVMQLQLASYPQDWPAVGFTYGHACMSYNCMSIFNYFMDAPGYGVNFINKLVFDPNISGNDDFVRKAIRVDTSGAVDKAGAIHDGLGKMNAKMLDMDFWNHRVNHVYSYDQDTTWSGYQFNRIKMVKQPGTTGWYRPEWTCIPQTLMNNYIPLNITATGSPKTVTCDFRPVADAVRGSSFRACFVAFNSKKEPRYGKVWDAGINSFALADDETAVYLAVIAVPKSLNYSHTHNDYTTDNVAMFPYRISLTGATPKGWQWAAPTSNFHTHTNGGGIVANTATVDASAYVGPNAMVLGTAKVYGNSRIEDYAVVDSSATIGRSGQSDNPVISGHAYVSGTAQVYGHAKVRDYGWVWGTSKVYDNALVLGHTMLNGASVFGNAVMTQAPLRDTGLCFSGSISGCAIIGGDTSGGGSYTTGVYIEFPGLSVTDNKYQYLGYNFEKKSSIFAMDQYGLNHGYLMGEPQSVSDTVNSTTTNVLNFNGTDQYVELKPDAVDFPDISITAWVKWTGSANDQRILSTGDGSTKYMYLTPKDGSTSKLRFVISNGTTTQYLDGTAALPANTWTHVAVTLSANTGVLYVNGTAVDTDTALSIDPDQLHAANMEDANYLGRGNSGNYFQGRMDEFRVYNKALTSAEVTSAMAVTAGAAPAADTTAPTPSTATWLVAPVASGDNAITMSATEGTDAGGNGVLYYFRCVTDPTHDSGWISENKYTDCNANPGTTYTYAVKMKDKLGNTGTESTQQSATAAGNDATAPTPNPPTFSSIPKGSGTTSITMTATKGVDSDELVMYKFTRVGTGITSGWTSSPTWTDTGLTSGSSYSYTLEMKDSHGNTTSTTTSASAVARDDTAPPLDSDFRLQWGTYPYTQLDKTIRMFARPQAETDVDYYYECVENPSINSGWMVRPGNVSPDNWTAVWVTPAMADGTYTFRFKLRDKSPQANQTGWSATKSAKVTTINSWHDYTISQLSSLPDDTLVRFSGKVTQVNPTSYVISTTDGSASINVVPRTFGYQTDGTLLNRDVNVKGHLWTYTGNPKAVTSAIVAGNPQTGKVEFENCEYDDDLARLLYDANASGREYLGWYQSGWSVTIPNVAAASEMTIAYGGGGGNLSLYLNGTHYRDVSMPYTGGSTTWGSTTVTGLSIPAGATLKFQQDSGDTAPNLDYVIIGSAYPISGKVTNSSGTAIAGAIVSFSGVPNASQNATYTAVTDASGNYSKTVSNGTWYVAATAASQAYITSADQTVVVNGAAKPNINFTLSLISRNFPRQSDLLFSCIPDMLRDSGDAGAWQTYSPTGITFASYGVPQVETLSGQKWEKNTVSTADCFRTPDYSSPIAVNGVTIVAVMKPTRTTTGNWQAGVNLFFDRVSFGIQNTSGQVLVKRNGSHDFSTATIPNGQTTVMSLVIQPDGKYKVYANGTQIMDVTTTSAMTSLVPGVPGVYAKTLSIGSNGPDGWSCFNGYIGDVCVYKVALTDAERQQLEADMTSRFAGGTTSYTINASAGTGGTITPSGSVSVNQGANQTFTIAPNAGYSIANVTVDGSSVGAVSTYTFNNVTANHTIAATFSASTCTITASAGANGTISPSGAVSVNYGGNQVFTITPNANYVVSDVTVDGSSVGAVTSYTFNNVTTNHTIAATFVAYSNDPIAIYEFENNVLDTLGNYDGTAFGSPTYVAGKVGSNAIQFNGTDQYASITRPVTNDFTIAFWVKTTQTSLSGGQWWQGSGLVDGEVGGSTTDFGVTYLNSKIAFGVGNPDVTFQSTSNINTGNWIHVACTRNSSTGQMKIYINGVLETTGTGTTGARTAPATLHIGNVQTGINYFNGAIDQLKIYNSVLSATDIEALVSEGANYTITASAGANGSISPSGDVTVNAGASQTFTITPTTGYYIEDVTVDGSSVGAVSSYTFSDVAADHTIAATFSVNTYEIVASAGSGGTIAPAGTVVLPYGGSQTFTITPNGGYTISNVTVDGSSVGAVSTYTFNNVTANHTISATFSGSTYTITASAGTGGTISPSGAVSVNSGGSQTFTIAPNTGYRINNVTVDGVSQGAISSYTFSNVTANHTISASFAALGRNVPKSDQLLFSAVTDTFPASGNTGNWATFCPAGQTLTTIGSPTVETIAGVKWEKNLFTDADGYLQGTYSSSIPVNGASIVVAVRPTMTTTNHDWDWRSIVDIFHDRLDLGVCNWNGKVCVRRNGSLDYSTASLPDGQITILSLVVQPDGKYRVYANGTLFMDNTTTSAMTSLVPNVPGPYANGIRVGKGVDGWSTFNGNIGDVFVYKVALSDADRQTLEADLTSKFAAYDITASAGAGGGISPAGATYVKAGASQLYTITPNTGYSIADVTVDGSSVGAVTSYTFTNVSADHTIAATFSPSTYTITPNPGPGGTISPSGPVTVAYGANYTFTIIPNTGYIIIDVTVDGASVGAVPSYTFSNVTANHTIAATFAPNTYTITASAGANGSINPSGNVAVVSGANQAFTITPNAGYAVAGVTVDGSAVGAVTSYTFNNVTANHTIAVTFMAAPLAWYQFENNVLDTMNAYNGTAYGSPTYVTGKIGSSAIQFNGTSQYVSITRPISTNWTIAFFVKTTQTSPTGTKWYNGKGIVDAEVAGTKNDFGVSYLNSKIAFGVGNPDTTFQSTSNINTGNWVHVACTRNSTTGEMKIYINGVLEKTGTGPTGTKAAASTIHIGNLQTNINYFAGAVDQLKIYNSVLSAADIATLAGQTGIMSVKATSAPAEASVSPVIDLSAASLEPGVLSEWKNEGTAGGIFRSDNTTPVVEAIDGKEAVTFGGNDWMAASFTAPATITGDHAFTTSVWAYNPQINTDETILSWATNARMYAESIPAGGWHLINVSYDKTSLSLYVDGVLISSEKRSLSTTPGMPVILGAAYTTEGSTYYPTLNFTGSIGSVKVYDRALGQAEISKIYKAGF